MVTNEQSHRRGHEKQLPPTVCSTKHHLGLRTVCSFRFRSRKEGCMARHAGREAVVTLFCRLQFWPCLKTRGGRRRCGEAARLKPKTITSTDKTTTSIHPRVATLCPMQTDTSKVGDVRSVSFHAATLGLRRRTAIHPSHTTTAGLPTSHEPSKLWFCAAIPQSRIKKRRLSRMAEGAAIRVSGLG